MRLSSDEFWAMTPRQFKLLDDRHREHLLHTEMVHAFTTQAVIHSGFAAPEKGVSLLDFMPNHPLRNQDSASSMTSEQQDTKDRYMARVMQLAAELKEKAATGATGPVLSELGYGK